MVEGGGFSFAVAMEYVCTFTGTWKDGEDHPYPTRNSLFALVCVRITPGIISSVIYGRTQLYMYDITRKQSATASATVHKAENFNSLPFYS